MSTLRATNIKHESSATNQIVLGADGSIGGTLGDTLAAKLDVAGGKVLQIVRATDTTARSTNSTTHVDANLNVTIAPQKSDSAILLLVLVRTSVTSSTGYPISYLQITDSSNVSVSGGEMEVGITAVSASTAYRVPATIIGYHSPATTSAVTYKTRFRTASANETLTLSNNFNTAQMYAIEVSA